MTENKQKNIGEFIGECKYCGNRDTLIINGPLITNREEADPEHLRLYGDIYLVTGSTCKGTKAYDKRELPSNLGLN